MVSWKQAVITSAILAVVQGQGVLLKAQGNKNSPASLSLQGMYICAGDLRSIISRSPAGTIITTMIFWMININNQNHITF